ncbi:MAG: prepilin-type N-terminal cleavage/methylation domain-containing protein, partial [Nitrospinota bacterium]
MQNSKFKINEDGLTIIELLIAMSIGLVVLGSVFSSFTTQKKAFALQEQITEMEQNLRTPIDFITRDLRNAGANPNINTTLVIGTSVGLIPNDPNDSDDPNVPITTDSIKILSDIDGNGSIPTTDTDVDEKITYTLNGTTLERNGNPL